MSPRRIGKLCKSSKQLDLVRTATRVVSNGWAIRLQQNIPAQKQPFNCHIAMDSRLSLRTIAPDSSPDSRLPIPIPILPRTLTFDSQWSSIFKISIQKPSRLITRTKLGECIATPQAGRFFWTFNRMEIRIDSLRIMDMIKSGWKKIMSG